MALSYVYQYCVCVCAYIYTRKYFKFRNKFTELKIKKKHNKLWVCLNISEASESMNPSLSLIFEKNIPIYTNASLYSWFFQS